MNKYLKLMMALLIVPAAISLGACGSDSGSEEAQQQGEQIGQEAQQQGEEIGEEAQKQGEQIGEKYEKEYGG